MDAPETARLCRALDRRWRGAWVQKVRQDREGRLYLKLRAGGRDGLLCLSALASAPGLGLCDVRPESPPRPPAVAAYLRAHAEGGRIESVHAPEGLAVAVFSIARAEGRTAALVLELLPPVPRLVALDGGGFVRALHPRERGESAEPRLVPGRPYRPPEVRPVPAAPSPESSPGDPADDDALLAAAGRSLFERAEEKRAETGERDRSRGEKRWRKRLETRRGKILADLERLGEEGAARRIADGVAARLGDIAPEREGVEVEEPPGSGRRVRVALDPGLSPGRNLDRLYAAAKKAERTRRAVLARLALTERELAQGPPDEATAPAGVRAGGRTASLPYRRYRSSDGWPIRVGRNGPENDRLLREAKPWDLWLHARGGAGAHVLVILPGREAKVPSRTLLEAAGLAALHSRLCSEAKVEVMAAPAGRVRKPKGASPGRVTVTGEETLVVAPGCGSPRPEGENPPRG